MRMINSFIKVTFIGDKKSKMTIEHIQQEGKGIFKAIETSEVIGHMTYYWRTEKIFVIDHTEVNPSHNGKGIGKQLVLSAVEFARENAFKIVPSCSYVKALFERMDSIQDVKG